MAYKYPNRQHPLFGRIVSLPRRRMSQQEDLVFIIVREQRQIALKRPPDRLPCMPGSPSCRTRDRGLRPSAIRAHVDQHDAGAGVEYVGYL